jgi:AcrR family transcriptional regulator
MSDVRRCHGYDRAMGRWEPNARGRLERAALELYGELGYEQTTVAEIARRAGLTERTFFRHFADKREVLFSGSGGLREALMNAVAAAPAEATPLDAVVAALRAVGEGFPLEHRAAASRRQAIIAANAELRERELVKLASLGATLAEPLRRRGIAEATASLTAEVGIALFRVTFERWLDEHNDREFGQLLLDSRDQLKAATA